MFIFTVSHSPSLSFPFTTSFFTPPSSSSSSSSFPSVSAIQTKRNNGVALLWFKHDLRIDDHPALSAASSHFPSLLPLYIFDPRILSRFPDEMLEIVLLALENLRHSLRDRGLDLLIKFGNSGTVIRDLVNEVKATDIFAEEEVEHELCELMDDVSQTLGSSNLTLWTTPFYDIKSLETLPESYDEFRKLQIPITPPFSSPSLPCLKPDLNWGTIPTFDGLKEFVNSSRLHKPREDWDLIKDTTAEALLRSKFFSRGSDEKDSNLKITKTDRTGGSIFSTQKGNNFRRGGTESVLNALAAYLRYNEGTARDDWQAIHEMQRISESRDGASFIKLFGPAIHLGIISRRRVHFEAIKYEKERNAGFLSPFGYSAGTVAAAVDAVLSIEWYWLMGLQNKGKHQGSHSIRNWRWNGFLVQYTVVGCEEGPAVLLVHGFGAFLEHFRDNIHDIAEGGNQVWAITFLGFGRSEKPNIVYSELLWAEFLRDFIIEVVGRPVHVVGNSIGGYIVSILAGLWPSLVKSIVLINSAGSVIPGYFAPFNKERQVSGAAWLGARFLLFYLRLKIKDTVRNCYPTRTERADDWLISEMLRASNDPGGLVVLESVFSFNLSVPLKYLFEGLEERVLIIQGMKDPIYNSKAMLAMLKEHCAGVIIKELDAGHCPHDEQPEEVNSILREWIVKVESKAKAGNVL